MRVFQSSLVRLIFLSSVLVSFLSFVSVEATPIYSLEMTEEYINYTVSWINGSLWAKVDGTYPLTKFNIEYPDQMGIDKSWFMFTDDTLSLVYPTPPGTTNITVKADETELEWSNYTQSFPWALHKTALGDWPMISCNVNPVLDRFILKIHYEHPIIQYNGSYAFLYDLNISPYLSPWSNKSTAHFNIRFETNIKDFKAYTITTDGKTNPVNYTTIKNDRTEVTSLQIKSEYSKPLLGDLLISFNEENEIKQPSSGLILSTIHYQAILGVVALSAILTISVLFLKHKRRGNKR